MREGYVKIHRKCMDNKLFLELPFDRWHAFEYLIMNARHAPTDVLLKGQVVHLDKGQLIVGIDKLGLKWGWSRNKVYRFMKLLKNLGMLDYFGTPSGTVITIENYGMYQGGRIASGTSDGTPDGTSDGTHKKNGKECYKNVKEIYIGVPPELLDAFKEFGEMRKQKKSPLTEKIVKRILNKLDRLANTTEEKIAILNQSTDNYWKDVYELKDKSDTSNSSPKYDERYGEIL